MIFKICKAHAMDFKEMMKELVNEDTYAGESFHPRMVAAMLRLGDLCDLDNDRFNHVAILVFGSLGEENLAHYFKHKSIETLHISRELIHIVADVSKTDLRTECEEDWFKGEEDISERVERIYQNTIREHIRWKNYMQDEISNLKQNVNALFPSDWSYVVPELIYDVKLNGEPVVTSDQNLKFDFSQQRAFKLIENISIYRTQKFIFIREIIQNAIDASKIQLWREIRDKYEEDVLKSPFTLSRYERDLYEKFKIEIKVSYDEKNNKVLFSFEDHGIGISRDELKKNILTTGRSWKEREEYEDELNEMPDWIRPTGAFGIGMHSIFSVTDHFKIKTKSDMEPYGNTIYLYSGKKGGYVFCEKGEKTSRGTIVEFEMDFSEEEYRDFVEHNFTVREHADYLKNTGDNFTDQVCKMVIYYCTTPLFPIEVNGDGGVPELTASSFFHELSACGERLLEHDDTEHSRFDYAFYSNYEGVAIWDKSKAIAYCVKIETEIGEYIQDLTINVAFKGMRIDEEIKMKDCITPFRIYYMDIEGGESSEFIDAGRSTISNSKRSEVKNDIRDMLDYALGLYIELGVRVYEDMEVQAYRKDLQDLVNDYVKGACDVNDVWEKVKRIWKTYFEENLEESRDTLTDNDFERVKVERDHVSYLVYMNLIQEMVLSLTKERYVSDAHGRYLLPLVDDLIRHIEIECEQIECEHQRAKTEFWENRFLLSSEMIMEHMMVVEGILLLMGENLSKKAEISEAESKNIGETFANQLSQMMPYVAKQKMMAKFFGHVERFLHTYKVRDAERTFSGNSVCDILLRPLSAIIFSAWGYKEPYGDKKWLFLYLSRPFLRVYMYVPGGGNKRYNRAWRQVISDTLYGNLTFYGGEKWYQKAGKPRVEITEEISKSAKYSEWMIFLQGNFFVAEIDKAGNDITWVYEAGESQQAPDYNPKRLEWLLKRGIPRNGLRYTMDFGDDLTSYNGCGKYPNISIQSQELEDYKYVMYDDGLFHIAWRIPAWDYKDNITGFLREHKDEPIDKVADRILETETFNRTAQYIERIQKKYGKNVKQEEIRKEYREFLIDLLPSLYSKRPLG
jgi:hypothetical protein